MRWCTVECSAYSKVFRLYSAVQWLVEVQVEEGAVTAVTVSVM